MTLSAMATESSPVCAGFPSEETLAVFGTDESASVVVSTW